MKQFDETLEKIESFRQQTFITSYETATKVIHLLSHHIT